jgi:outer membrane receptor protein involved in Fe transport
LPFDLGPNLILVIYGNPELERERIDSTQAGFAWRFNPRAVLRMDLYSNRVDEFIYRGPGQFAFGAPSEIQIPYANRAQAFTVAGGEVTLLTRPAESLHVNVAYAYRGTSLSYGDPVNAYAPRHKGYLLVDWTPAPRWSVNVATQWTSSYTASSPDVFGLRPQPSYALYDAGVHYTFPVRGGEIALELDGHNLADEHPYETLVSPDVDTSLRGRFATFGVRFTF